MYFEGGPRSENKETGDGRVARTKLYEPLERAREHAAVPLKGDQGTLPFQSTYGFLHYSRLILH